MTVPFFQFEGWYFPRGADMAKESGTGVCWKPITMGRVSTIAWPFGVKLGEGASGILVLEVLEALLLRRW